MDIGKIQHFEMSSLKCFAGNSHLRTQTSKKNQSLSAQRSVDVAVKVLQCNSFELDSFADIFRVILDFMHASGDFLLGIFGDFLKQQFCSTGAHTTGAIGLLLRIRRMRNRRMWTFTQKLHVQRHLMCTYTYVSVRKPPASADFRCRLLIAQDRPVELF